jgi:hypothetical protein
MMPTDLRKQAAAIATLLLVVCCCWAVPGEAYRYSVFVTASTATWTVPPGASDISLTLWGGGGGAASLQPCAGSGGSGATILNRTANDATWGILPSNAQWEIVIGQGGAGSTTWSPPYVGGDGGATAVRAIHPNGTVLVEMTAYGGGGANAGPAYPGGGPTCRGGAGGGASSSAVGTTPGGGVPSGGVDNSDYNQPQQGQLVGDIKAGGAGGGANFTYGTTTDLYLDGADWTVGNRQFTGGQGSLDLYCISWGGAAGYNGNGASGATIITNANAAPNSGAGGGTALMCSPTRHMQDGAGGSGGVIIEYNHPVGPTPSATRTPAPSRTPSTTPSPSSQPLSQLITLVSSISGKHLTPADDGSTVQSLWTVPTYKEKWTATRLANGKYAFKGFNGRYLTAFSASPDGYVECQATSIGSDQQWTVIIGPSNLWTLKSAYNTYLGATTGGVVYLNNNADLVWTKTVV